MALAVITSVTPASGSLHGATSVAIVGTGFTGTTAVTFGGVAATSFNVVNDTHLTAVAPAHALGEVDIVVTNGTGDSLVIPADQFTYVAVVPTISSVSPSGGAFGGGTSVTLVGLDFTGATKVAFGGVPATSFTVTNDTHITAVAPARTGRALVDVVVTNAVGASLPVTADHFTYTPATYTQPEGSADGTDYFMDIAITPANLKSGALVERFDPIAFPGRGVTTADKAGAS